MAKYFFTSITRISNLPEVSFSVEPLPRKVWGTGDYVVGEFSSPPSSLVDPEKQVDVGMNDASATIRSRAIARFRCFSGAFPAKSEDGATT